MGTDERRNGSAVDAGNVQYTFRPTLKHWLSEIIGPVLLFLGMAGAVMALDAARGRALLILAAIGALSFLGSAFFAARTRLDLDVQGLRGRIRRRSFDVRWSEVLALQQVRDDRKGVFLYIATSDRFDWLSLEGLNVVAVWRAVTQLAPAAVLADDAFDRLPAVQAAKAARATLLDGTAGPVRVRVVRWIGWLGLLSAVFLGFLLIKLFGGDFSRLLTLDAWPLWLVLLFFLGMLAGSFYLVYVALAVIELGPQAVCVRAPLGLTYKIRWDEVLQAESDGQGTLVLTGKGRRLTLLGPPFWRTSDRDTGTAALYGHLEAHQIPLKRSPWAQFKVSKGTRVRRSRKMPGN